MDVLNNKFELPLSKEELAKKYAEDNLNTVLTQDSGKISKLFPELKDIEIKNKSEDKPLPKPIPAVAPDPDKPKQLIREDTKRPEEEWIKPPPVEDGSNPTDLPPNKTPQLQFRKLADRPITILNMPDHSGEIDMMGKGEGIKNVEGKAWARAWSYLDTPTAPAGFDPGYDFLFKSRLNQGGRPRTNVIATSYATPPGGVYRYNGTGWDSLVHDYGVPFERDNGLLMLNAWRSVKTGSPVDKYDIDSASWSKLSGDLPVLEATDWGVFAGCLHNGIMYITTRGKILKETGSGWDIVYEEDPDLGGDFYSIASDGNDVYFTSEQDPVVGETTRLNKLNGGSPIIVKELDGAKYGSRLLGYGTNSEKFYWGVEDFVTNKYDYYSSPGSGVTKILSAAAGFQIDNPVASGSKYDYLTVGDSIRRIDDDLTSIFTDGFNVGSLVGFDEQICIGGQNSIFHSEWEGTPNLQAADTKGDAKFGL